MSADVTLPADVARQMAEAWRTTAASCDDRAGEWADLLDPRPPNLRDEVALALADSRNDSWHDYADAALAVVKARIEALPYFVPETLAVLEAVIRDDVLALFGDES